MLDINRILKSNRQMKALTGMNIIEFELLVPRIDDSISLKILSKKVRKRKAGGGRKGVLNSMELKLFLQLIVELCLLNLLILQKIKILML